MNASLFAQDVKERGTRLKRLPSESKIRSPGG